MPKKTYERPLRVSGGRKSRKAMKAGQLTLPSLLNPGGEIPMSDALDIVFSMMDPPEQPAMEVNE